MQGRSRALVAAAALVVGGLAGCLAARDVQPAVTPALEPLSEAKGKLGQFLATSFASFDGTNIHVDVQLPEGNGPWPTLVEFTPYSLLGDDVWGAQRDLGMASPYALADYYVPRGYAVAVAHVRGTGESGGCLTVGGPEEGKDGYALVEFLAKQKWSSGKVAMIGTSWVGTTPIETAVLNPPHLTTIVPMSSVSSWYTYYFELGAQRNNGDPPPGSSNTDPAFDLALGGVPGPRTLATGGPEDYACIAEFTREYETQTDFDAYWQARNHAAKTANITVPVLYAQGFLDENVATTMIPEFLPLLKSEHRAWLEQHKHGVPSSKKDYYEYQHRWLDYWMLGKQNGALDLPTVVVEDNQGKFRAEAQWPPVDAKSVVYAFASAGKLAEGPAATSASSETYMDDGYEGFTQPLKIVGGFAPIGTPTDPVPGAHSITFTSPPAQSDLRIAGAPVLHLYAASDATSTHFAALVYAQSADGAWKFLTRGYLDARHRESLTTGKDLDPGKKCEFVFPLHPRDYVLKTGESLVVVVKSSDPYVVSDKTRAANTLYLGAGGSWIDLPVVDARTAGEKAPRPAAWGPLAS